MFKKYCRLLKTGMIDFKDPDIKAFVMGFINNSELKNALKKSKQKTKYQKQIAISFNFIKETYGTLPEEDIMDDLKYLFLILTKRYKAIGKSFCGYIMGCYRWEVLRHIKKFLKDPCNVPYKQVDYENIIKFIESEQDTDFKADSYYELKTGLPDFNWVLGKECSPEFGCLNTLERKILIKYYLENYPDKLISQALGLAIAEINTIRRKAVLKIAKFLAIDPDKIRRGRNTVTQVNKILSLKLRQK